MEKVAVCLEALAEAVHDSSAYREFEKAKADLKEYPELKKKLDEFRKRNFQIQNIGEDHDLFQEIQNIQMEFAQFRKNPLVDEYLKSELKVCRMLQKIDQDIMDILDMDIDGFAGELDL